jgi:hypothetical protein
VSVAVIAGSLFLCLFVGQLLARGIVLVALLPDRFFEGLNPEPSLRLALSIICAILVTVLGGVFAAAAASHSPIRHSAYAGLVPAAALLAVFAYGTCVNVVLWPQRNVIPPGSDVPWGPGKSDAQRVLEDLRIVASLSVVPLNGFLLGAALERGARLLGRRLFPRKRWEYTARSGVSFPVYGPWRHPVGAALWRAIGWVLMWTCWVGLLLPGEVSERIWSCIFLFLVGRVCLILARRRTATAARAALETDERPPIVYLRSFRDDGVGVTGWWYEALQSVHALLNKTIEERLIDVLSRYGPVVTIGRPGEELPELGAARVYVGDDHWQNLITDLLSEPGAVAVLRAGETQGLRWELQKIGGMLSPSQVLLFLPFAMKGSRANRDARYGAFRAWAGECFPA